MLQLSSDDTKPFNYKHERKLGILGGGREKSLIKSNLVLKVHEMSLSDILQAIKIVTFSYSLHNNF